jgi:enoyl-CoA hydratase
MDLQTLLYDVRDRIGLITINRPDKLNALNAEAKRELGEVVGAIQSDPDVDVLIITGAGAKAFVAGTDIAELAELDRETGEEFSAKGQQLFDRIENLAKPVIAAVNGYALGGGCELALACHVRIASENARFGQPEVQLGVIPGYGGTQRLARLVGRGKAMEMILGGAPIDAAEALRIGLVNSLVPGDELMNAARDLARRIASNGQAAVRLALKAVNTTQQTTLSDGQTIEAELFGESCSTVDFKEGVGAFLEKRKPRFQGK